MKPLLNFISSTLLAANNISKADANSAAENSFKTKQHLNGSNFSSLFFGIKNILIIIFFLILTISPSKSKECLDFLPFGHNDNYVQLPKESEFCIKYGKQDLIFKTDKKGGRYFKKLNEDTIQVFGDSQILGVDIQDQKDHFLSNSYKKNLVIYAAPNNGPYQVLNFIILNQENIKKKIIINFNLSVDMFRLSPDYNIQNYVALRDDQLNDIIEKPFKYKLIIFKSLITNKFFTISRKNQKKMQILFENKNTAELEKNLNIYFENLNEIINKFNIEIDYILTMPYWIYNQDENNDSFYINSNLELKLKLLVCKTFAKNKKLHNKYISVLDNNNKILTEDKRHIRLDKIVLTDLVNYCKY
tara:strand:- start:1860 stop:2936 length:1077 start_codon:yes stop_codon:yes gene_type:complete